MSNNHDAQLIDLSITDQWVQAITKFYSKKHALSYKQAVDSSVKTISIKNCDEKHLIDEETLFSHINGDTLFKGKVMGRCRIILQHQKNYELLVNGEILVTDQLVPDMAKCLSKVNGIVLLGRKWSREAVLVCQILQIPSLMISKKDFVRIETGILVRLDACKGLIKLIY